jgi:hypothetical protein
MRRLLSILLLLGLGMGPAFASIPAHALASGWTGKVDEAAVPACCRRNGKHHCAMSAMQALEGETMFSSSDCCPCMPHGDATTVSNHVAIAVAAASILHRDNSRTPISVQSQQHGSNQERTQLQRGPPDPFLL